MTESRAKKVAFSMMAISGFLSFNYIFIEQDLLLALFSISGIFTFSFARENPKVMLSSSWKEFGECIDVATGKDKITGNPTYYAVVLFSALYIFIV